MAQTGTAVCLVSSLGLQASSVELLRDVAELSSSPWLCRRPPLESEKGPGLRTGGIASWVIALSITRSLIFASCTCIWWWIWLCRPLMGIFSRSLGGGGCTGTAAEVRCSGMQTVHSKAPKDLQMVAAVAF